MNRTPSLPIRPAAPHIAPAVPSEPTAAPDLATARRGGRHRWRRVHRVVRLLAVVAMMAASGCISDEATTVSLDDGDAERVLPSVTAGDRSSDQADAADGAGASGQSGTDQQDDTTQPTAPAAPLQGLSPTLIADGFDQPIFVTGAPGTDALFVVEREGIIWVVEDGQRHPEPFLDLRADLLSSSIEQGLLGLAFHPDYAENGRVFAYWTDPSGDSVLAEFAAQTPTEVEAETKQVVFTVDQPAERHNAGMVTFGPDGLLYLALGDGGNGGSEAQDITNPLGAIVRLDVEGTPGEYRIPPGNPFDDEIWVYGLRNPWRFSIDHQSELVYIGDVGQDTFEEINIVSLDGAGTNFGWSQAEGDRCFRSDCDLDQFTKPVLQYSHDEGCSVTGGVVYRGAAIPEMVGHYFFADWCGGLVRTFRYHNGGVTDQLDWSTELEALGQVTSFGEGPHGELYVVNWDGQLYRIDAVR